MKLEEKLVSLRKEKGLSQQEAAEKIGVSRQAISRWEVGTAVPSVENLKLLSRLYGVSVDNLLMECREKAVPAQEHGGLGGAELERTPEIEPEPAVEEIQKRDGDRFTKCVKAAVCVLLVAAGAALGMWISNCLTEEKPQVYALEEMEREAWDWDDANTETFWLDW